MDDERKSPPADPPSGQVNLDDVDRDTYLRIKRIVSRFARHRLNPTLTPTVIAHEVWIRLRKSSSPLRVRDSSHFDALVGQAASFVTNDAARRRLSQKRGGPRVADVDLDTQAARQASLDTILQMNQALTDLDAENATMAGILRDFYFEGLTVAEISTKREISRRTVERTLTLGRAWLHDRLTRPPDDSQAKHDL